MVLICKSLEGRNGVVLNALSKLDNNCELFFEISDIKLF